MCRSPTQRARNNFYALCRSTVHPAFDHEIQENLKASFKIKFKQTDLLYIGVTSSILIGYKHAANSCLLCFSYVIPTNNRFYICRIDVIPTDNSFMHAEVTSPDTLTSTLISFVMAELSSGICIIKQLLNSVFAC